MKIENLLLEGKALKAHQRDVKKLSESLLPIMQLLVEAELIIIPDLKTVKGKKYCVEIPLSSVCFNGGIQINTQAFSKACKKS